MVVPERGMLTSGAGTDETMVSRSAVMSFFSPPGHLVVAQPSLRGVGGGGDKGGERRADAPS